MSFNTPKIERPYAKTYEYKGTAGNGHFRYYDGTKNHTLPAADLAPFVVLEEMKSISGFCEEKNRGIWSNEVLNLQTEPFKVRVDKVIICEGIYGDIKDTIKANGGKFTCVVFALIKGEIVRLLFAGSGCGGWIDKGFDPMAKQCGVKLTGTQSGKKGQTSFETPLFEPVTLNAEQIAEAIKQCDLLTAWLDSKQTETADDGPSDADERAAIESVNQEPAGNRNFAEAAETTQEEVPF